MYEAIATTINHAKMKIVQSILLVAVLLLSSSCMTEREYQLRKKDIAAKQSWPATYQPVVIKGPLTLDKESELVVTVPNQPYTPSQIPNGQAIQAQLAKDIVTTGAIIGGAVYSIHKAGGKKTIINNNAPAE